MSPEREVVKKFEWRPAAGAAVVVLLVVVFILLVDDRLYPAGLGPVQPIPFSHRVHVGVKKVSCILCHNRVIDSARAGVPPLETCLLCHRRVIPTHPYIVKLTGHYRTGDPVVWQRVNWLPEFVYFNHSLHIGRGVDCGVCHGNVGAMDRVVAAREFRMGFCVQCHRDRHATHDCLACHR